MSKYCQGLEKYFNNELRASIKKIQDTYEPQDILIKLIKLVLNYHKSQNDFFFELSKLDRFFASMYSKFHTSFVHLIKHSLFYELQYEKHFDDYFDVVFEDYKLNIVKHFTQKLLEVDDKSYTMFTLIVQELSPPEIQDKEQIFNVSGLRRFIRFHEYFDIFKSVLKPNLSRFFIKKIDQFMDTLVEQSNIETERFEEEIDIQPGSEKKFKKIMPYVKVYIDTLIVSTLNKIEDQRTYATNELIEFQMNMSDINRPKITVSQADDKFHHSFLNSLNKDSNFLFVKKLGSDILSYVLDFKANISRIEEIADVVKKVRMSEELSQWLLDQIKSRLLTPGVTTMNILSTYFHIVETLTIIDEDMLSFKQVTTPVKKFLLQRVDLINCILTFWKQDPKLIVNSQIMSQPRLEHHPSLQIPISAEEMHHLSSDDENEEINVRHIKRSSNQSRVRYKVSDPTKILVDLYGSEEGFLEEYQNDLATKYLLDKDIDAKNMAMEIEIVKKRFGEYNLSRCDVLTKDVKDSKRISKCWSKEIRHDVSHGKRFFNLKNENFSTLIASTGYWPVDNHDPLFQMPKTMTRTLENFENVYKVRNPNKKLKYHQNLGSVTIDLDFPSSSHEFKCQPIHALIMSFFSEGTPLSKEFNIQFDPKNIKLSQIALCLRANPSYIKKKMYFWIHNGVIVEKKSGGKGTIDDFGEYHAPDVIYSIVDDLPPVDESEDIEDAREAWDSFDEEHESISTKDLFFKGENYQDEVQSVQKEIINILRNYGPKKLEKLVKVVQQLETGLGLTIPMSKNDIEELLDSMVKRGQIVYQNYIYYPGIV